MANPSTSWSSPQKEYGYRNGQLLITASSSQRQWLVSDHLGTPRMVIDQTGSLANMKRHDYLPFGEELLAGTGGRTAAQGYSSGDGVRQQFTSKERDIETGLDYFLARYYSAVQGRFASPDEFSGGPDDLFDFTENASQNPTFYADLSNPQSLNKYQYVYNDPLNMVDPDGHCPVICPPVAGLGDSLELITNPSRALDKLQAKISIAGLAPGVGEVADGFNAAISLVRGNYKEALLDAAAAAGPVGSAAALGNRIRKLAKATSRVNGAVEEVADVSTTLKRATKLDGVITQPNAAPAGTIVHQQGVTITRRTRDHAPPHLHVSGKGPSTRIGQNGKPLANNPSLSTRQREVVQSNLRKIRKMVRKVMKEHRFNEQ